MGKLNSSGHVYFERFCYYYKIIPLGIGRKLNVYETPRRHQDDF